MGRMSHKSLIFISGCLWIAVGMFLLPRGLKLLVAGSVPARYFDSLPYPLLDYLSPMVGGIETAAVIIIAVALVIGYLKARFVLSKTVKRVVTRVLSLPNPVAFTAIYGKGYLLLIASMMGLGFVIRYTGVPDDVRGLINVAIGSALINGGLIYLRCGFDMKKAETLI
ncbi:MAG: hypothetical protein H7A37_03240 [Chlamydiales bacterium]|nr:hypothetical protein [Chlamydiales bacterium]